MVSSTCDRKFIVGGNWKANGTRDSVAKILAALAEGAPSVPLDIDVVVAPPLLHLSTAVDSVGASVNSSLPSGATPWAVSAQDVGERGAGAFTGDVPAELLRDAGVSWGIVGHSERRAAPRSESDCTVAAKAVAALSSGLCVIACVGETLEEREAGRAIEVVTRQLRAVVDAVAKFKGPAPPPQTATSAANGDSSSSSEANGHAAGNGNGNSNGSDDGDRWRRRLVVAYEPVWAIGTGRVATPEQAQEMHAAIRAAVADAVSVEAAEALRIQYGGSVSPKNAASLAACPDVDGFLVGGASLKPGDFLEIIKLGAAAKKKEEHAVVEAAEANGNGK